MTMHSYLSTKIRIISFLALMLVFLQHAMNVVGYIDPRSLFHLPLTFNNYIQLFIGYGIAPVCIPLFFTISAYLMFHNYSYSRALHKYTSRIHSLVIPYIAWSIVGILALGTLQHLPIVGSYFLTFYTGDVWNRPIFSYITTIVTHGVSFHLWFIFELIIYTLFAPLIYILTRYAKFLPAALIFLLWLFGRSYNLHWVSWEHVGFYALGAYIALHPHLFRIKISKQMVIIITALWIGVLSIKTFVLLGQFAPFESINVILHRISLIFGSMALWYGYDYLVARLPIVTLEYYAGYSFFVYAAHEPLLELLKKMMLDSQIYTHIPSFAIYLMVPTITLLMCFWAAISFKKWFRRLYPLLSGHR